MKLLHILLIVLVLTACENKEKEEKKPYVRNTEEVLEVYPNGVKKMEGKLVNGERHGEWKYYYNNGFLWSEGKYWYGKRKGYSVVYYESGKKKIEGNYKEDEKVGIWKLWNPDGSLNKTINMDQPTLEKDSLKQEDKLK